MFKKAFSFIFLSISFSIFSQQYPVLEQIVTDSATIFTPNQLEGLRKKLTDFEKETTNQLVVLTINGLGYETIETYANKTFNQNGLGQKGKDNGLLILFSKLDREVRIEVGYGLEPYITDAVASRIIRNTMIPKFKEEKYFEGIDGAANQIITLLNNPEALEEFKTEMEESQRRDDRIGMVFMLIFFSVFVLAGGFFFYRTYKGFIELFRGMFIGKIGLVSGLFLVVFSAIPVFMSLFFLALPVFLFLMFNEYDLSKYEFLLKDSKYVIYFLIGFLLFTVVIALIKIKIFGKEDLKISMIKNDKSYMRKTFSSSGSSSFGSSSSSSSFSGRGGSSGGGGASGSW
ncbi:TPM domain-containing protein [Maribacter sp. 2210JD10-5]|uniref:TPM domain-containing protein n=1 Tax=Maribacter sp. 2210JD10-5 TaxID=3386272 RepID=UPI0039BD6FFD